MAGALIVAVTFLSDTSVVGNLSGTTATLLLAVFSVVNVCCLVLRRVPTPEGAFRSPGLLPAIAALLTLYLLGPWAKTESQMIEYKIAGLLLLLGVVLWLVTWLMNSGVRAQKTGFRDIEHLEDVDDQ